jgi:hypothetical protein
VVDHVQTNTTLSLAQMDKHASLSLSSGNYIG